MGVTERALTALELIFSPASHISYHFCTYIRSCGIAVKLPDVTVSLVARSLCGWCVTRYGCDGEYVLEETGEEGCNE